MKKKIILILSVFIMIVGGYFMIQPHNPFSTALGGSPDDAKTYDFNVDVQETKFDGIKVWTIKDKTSKLLHVKFVFKNAGRAFEKKLGSLSVLDATVFDGADKLDAYHFQEFLMNHQLILSVVFGPDDSYIALQTPPENLKYGLQALTMIFKKLRLDTDEFKRAKEGIVLGLEQSKMEPRSLADDYSKDFLYEKHPYFTKREAMIAAVKSIKPEDVRSALHDHFTIDRMSCIVLGNYDDKTIEGFIHEIKALLKPNSDLANTLPMITLKNSGKTKYFFMNVPQSIILFAMKSLHYSHPDYYALEVFNNIMGGNSFTSRLWTTIREDRGLAYFVRTGFVGLRSTDIIKGIMGTSTAQVDQAVGLVKTTIKDAIEKGVTQKELDFEKRYITGNFLTSFDSLREMSGVLTSYITDFTLDDLKNHNKKIASLTLKDVKRAAKEHLKSDDLVMCILGNHPQ